MFNVEMLQNLINQQKIDNPTSPEDELLRHQKPLASVMRSLIDILEYEKQNLSMEVFNALVESLQTNLNNQINRIKMPAIPNATEIVSINGHSVNEINEKK